jgi:hypothetical protein
MTYHLNEVTSGDNPTGFQVIINLPNEYMRSLVDKWIASGDFKDKFWSWAGANELNE